MFVLLFSLVLLFAGTMIMIFSFTTPKQNINILMRIYTYILIIMMI